MIVFTSYVAVVQVKFYLFDPSFSVHILIEGIVCKDAKLFASTQPSRFISKDKNQRLIGH